MVNGVERPLDLLNDLKGKSALVEVKGRNEPIEGTLIAFDIHINLVLEVNGKPQFVRGDIVETVSPKK
jgi:small nuclear ribonucleoprotein (snRNP)-like protein